MEQRLVTIYLLMQAVGFLATWRYSRHKPAAQAQRIRRKFLVFFGITASVFVAAFLGHPFTALAILIALAGFYEIGRLAPQDLRTGTLALLVFAPVALGFVLFALRGSLAIIVGIYAIITALDGFSQVAGQWLGRRPLAPRISPNKTVEGVLGGITASGAAYALLVDFDLDRLQILALAVVLLAGVAGDLLGSAYKRRMRVKDFSGLVPYHGGVLDRFGSFMLAGSVHYALSFVRVAL